MSREKCKPRYKENVSEQSVVRQLYNINVWITKCCKALLHNRVYNIHYVLTGTKIEVTYCVRKVSLLPYVLGEWQSQRRLLFT